MILSSMLILALFAGCSNANDAQSSSVSPSGEGSSNASDFEREMIELKLVYLNFPGIGDNWEKVSPNSSIKQYLNDELKLELQPVGLDSDQSSVAMASGDLGDVLCITTTVEANTLIDSNRLHPLNDLVGQYAPHIPELIKNSWNAATNIYGRDGVAYYLPVCEGIEGPYPINYHYRYTIRWDYWEELGFPEFTDEESFLNVVAQMQEKHPTTDSGEYPTYGVSFYIDTGNSTFWFEDLERGTTGYLAFADNYPRISTRTGAMVDNYGDFVNGPYWRTINYYRTAYKMGLLDPESFSQTSEDISMKFDRGQLLTAYESNRGENYARQQAENGNEYADFVQVPVDGALVYQNCYSGAGWEIYFASIPTSCRDTSRAMEFLSWTYSTEGARMFYSGAENVDWHYVDGKAVPTDERINQYLSGGDDWAENGLGMPMFFILSGIANMTECSDGSPANLYMTAPVFSKNVTTKAAQAFCQKYDVTYPTEAFLNRVEEGRMYDISHYNEQVNAMMSNVPDDIARIDGQIITRAKDYIQRLITASDDEFASLQQQFLDEIKSIGYETANVYWFQTYKNVCDELGYQEYYKDVVFPEGVK